MTKDKTQRISRVMLIGGIFNDKKIKEMKCLLGKKEKEKSPFEKRKSATQVSEPSCNSLHITKYATPYRRGGIFRSQFSCKNFDNASIAITV